MTNKEILKTAMKQSAIDNTCTADDFIKNENVIVYSKLNEGARNYLKLPHYCNLTSYGNNIVATIDTSIEDIVGEFLGNFSIEHCFETPYLHALNDKLQEKDMRICFMAEYFLPDVEVMKRLKCSYKLKILDADDLSKLTNKIWRNALSSDERRHLDVLGVGAYDKDKLIGLAACSMDCNTMWQIGVDVLPEYRKKNIGAAVTSNLACEILERNIVPFYCCAWSNIKSVRNAITSGFKFAWVEMTAKSKEFVEDMNK